ncbi:hypothetical protein NP493_6205g00000 [Ridgeia piscesae]|uniref:Uncharacterized protein n=1 Tax=Ridgeia piscesae TaxID=27915 RepID=A0AAD9MQ18_RIDPI|nr:hypothetical protein NP493_6205g00000 [Ridgeia piscesae]
MQTVSTDGRSGTACIARASRHGQPSRRDRQQFAVRTLAWNAFQALRQTPLSAGSCECFLVSRKCWQFQTDSLHGKGPSYLTIAL